METIHRPNIQFLEQALAHADLLYGGTHIPTYTASGLFIRMEHTLNAACQIDRAGAQAVVFQYALQGSDIQRAIANYLIRMPEMQSPDMRIYRSEENSATVEYTHFT